MELLKVELMSAEWDVLQRIFTEYSQRALHVAFRGTLLQIQNVHLWGFVLPFFFLFVFSSIGTWKVLVENKIAI